MLETKATLKTMEKLLAKRIITFVFLLGSRPNLKFNFATKKKNMQQPHYTNPLFALIYFENHTLSIISINTIAKSAVNWNKLDVKLDVKPDIRLSRGLTNTFLAFWKDDWAIAFELEPFFFIKNMHKLWMVFMYTANLKRKKKCVNNQIIIK